MLPPAASAHVAGVEYKFPLPIWLYAVAAGAAVLASAPAAAVALRGGSDRVSGNVYFGRSRLRPGVAATALAGLLLVVAIVGGLFGDQVSFTANPGPLLTWVVFWVGLGIVSSLLGNVWDFVSPLNAAARTLDRLLARRDVPARTYPEWLGVWPSVLLLLAWTWAELLWEDGDRGRQIALVLLGYVVLQLVACGLFGAEVWLARGELFTVVARTFGRFAPLELYVEEPAGACRAGQCPEGTGERIGCPACWLEAPPERRGLRLRPYGAGIRREAPLLAGGGAFVVALLATVVYDGFRSTSSYAEFESRLFPGSPAYASGIGTLTFALVVGVFVAAFVAICACVGGLERDRIEAVARRYAPTLIPIAAVYFVSHYFLYFFYLSQFAPGAIADPFEREWVPDYVPWTKVPGAVVWYLQVGLIVWGHVVAVIEAHRVSLRTNRSLRLALTSQLPLVLLMVGYTFSGLWVLGQSLARAG